MALFNDSVPAGSEAVKLGASRIREMKTTLNTALSQIFSDSLVFIPKFVTSTLLANDASDNSLRAVDTNHIKTGAVATAKIADGALTADAAGRLKMADLFITLAKLATDIFNTVTLKSTPVNGDKFILADSEASGATKYTTIPGLAPVVATAIRANATQRYASSELTLVDASQLLSAAHGLAALPTDVRVVMVAQSGGSALAGYTAGEEIPACFWSDGDTQRPIFACSVDATTVSLVMANTGNGIRVAHKTTGAYTVVSAANFASWKAKVYLDL